MISKDKFEKEILTGTILNYAREWNDKPQIKFDITPIDFLGYAESDLSTKSSGGLVNALSNIKRAIDSQIEIIIFEHGLKNKVKKKRWKFPDKIKFLREKHILAPRVIEKINKTRNQLEHEFRKPDFESVEDSFGIAILFIGYCKQLQKVPDTIHVGIDTTTTKSFNVYFDKNDFTFVVSDDDKKLFTINENDSSFERLINLFYGIQPATYSLVHKSQLFSKTY